MTIDNPTRNQYLTICGGLPPQRGKACDLTPRELREIDAVKVAVYKHIRFHENIIQNWRRLPCTTNGAVVVNLGVHEIYEKERDFADAVIVHLWKSIGTPIITQENGETAFHVEDGVWPYVASDEGRDEHDVLRVEDRLIDIDHVCSLIEDAFADLLMYFWGQRCFDIIRMTRDFVDHLNIHGLDDTGRAKMKLLEEEVHPFAPETNRHHPYNDYYLLMKKESEADGKQ
jgi:hypothetical protein